MTIGNNLMIIPNRDRSAENGESRIMFNYPMNSSTFIGMRKYQTDLPLDSPERTLFHRQIIIQKRCLRTLYEEWYSVFSKEIPSLPNDVFIELGSGGGFFKQLEPKAICSDIIDLPTNDITFSALEMPFGEHSVGGIFMVDTMHHIPDSDLFLKEVDRVLEVGGKMVMIEPANSWWGRFIFKNFHHEPFIPDGGWSIPSTGPLSGANGALPWIVFVRDNELFQQKFPGLIIDSIQYINPLSYLMTGGVSRKQFLPDFLFPVLRFADKILPAISKQLSMFMVVKIRKTQHATEIGSTSVSVA
jgi:SAM-dependent methyltransferase